MDYPPSTTFRAVRIGDAPIVRPDMPGLEGALGENVNGPSLIKAPEWLPGRLGNYYLYFAHHGGAYIRLAIADRIEGPWRVHKPGTLSTDELQRAFQNADPYLPPADPYAARPPDHVASPDVHVDEARREVRMYFHAAKKGWPGQITFCATSADGLRFRPAPVPMGPFYLRAFEHRGATYALAKWRDQGCAVCRSPDGLQPFERGPVFMPNCRHTAVWQRGRTLYMFHSNYREIERILVSTIDLSAPWRQWRPRDTQLVLEPQRPYEGADLPLEPSTPGAIHGPARQLRDPAIYEEDGRLYLLYSVAGERGIALARLDFDVDATPGRFL